MNNIAKIPIENDLLAQVIQLSGLQDKTEAINTALKEYIINRKKQNVVDMFDTIDYYDDYDYKSDRKKDMVYENFG